MAMLDDVLKQSQPGVNPQLEEMVSKMLASSGMAGPDAQAAAGKAMLSGSATGQGMPLGAPQAAAMTGQAGMPQAQTQGQPGLEANETYRVLVSRGVPPELAKQAIGDPNMLRQILQQLFKGQQGAQEQPQMAPSPNPNTQSAPPLGGGGGYG